MQIITNINSRYQQQTWQDSLTNAVTDPAELLKLLNIDPSAVLPNAYLATQQFALRVPHEFIARMKKGDFNDPLLRQVLPIQEELHEVPGYSYDPLFERLTNPKPGLLHKYHGRVLLTVASNCGVNCRFCFRRHFPYAENNPGTKGWTHALEYIAQDPSIHEVIYSGGDPLIATDKQLAYLTERIAAIPHVKTLRIHTRMPIVIPSRVNNDLLAWLNHTRLRTILVTHCNHAHEIDAHVKAAMAALRDIGVTLLNQAVLLKEVNDTAPALIDLSYALFDAGIMPYYLHLLDKVQGVSHFEVTKAQGQQLMEALLQQLPGYLVPRLVQEQGGALSKRPIALKDS